MTLVSQVVALASRIATEITTLRGTVNGKEPAIVAGTVAQYWRGDKSWQALNAGLVLAAAVTNATAGDDAAYPESSPYWKIVNPGDGWPASGHLRGMRGVNFHTQMLVAQATGAVSVRYWTPGPNTWSAWSALATSSDLTTKADLVGGVVPSSQIPAIALVSRQVVASQAAMLALTAAQVQPGDIAIRTDGAGTFILTAADPSVLGNWSLLNAPTDAVVSVNTQVGTVVLGKADVGLGNVDNTADTAKPVSTAQQTALNGKEASIAAGTADQFWRGDKTWAQFLAASGTPFNLQNSGSLGSSATAAKSDHAHGMSFTVQTGTALPSAYTNTGIMTFIVSAGTAGWPSTSGFVITFRPASSRVVQWFYDEAGNAYVRTQTSVDVWSAWSEIVHAVSPVHAATTVAITLSGPQTVDTVPLVAGNRCLVKNQTAGGTPGSDNGVYVVAAGAWTRAVDADTAAKLNGAEVVVMRGTQAGQRWRTNFAESATLGSVAVRWAEAYSDLNPPQSLAMTQAASAPDTTLTGQAQLFSTDGQSLSMKNPAGTVSKVADGNAWTAYTPVWSASSSAITAPHTVTGAYQQIGKTVNYRIRVVVGTGGIGTGTYEWTLPVTAKEGISVVGGLLFRRGSTLFYERLAFSNTAATGVQASDNAGARMTNAAPAAPQSGDVISISGTYEAA